MTRARDLARFANNQAISVDADFDVGINSSSPAATLDVRGNTVITGILTATSFSGNSTGLSGTPDITVNNIVAAGATFSGVLTYEDVTNVDSVGVVTARLGVKVTGGEIAVGAAFSVGQAGVVTATSFSGDGSGLTGVASTDNINTSTLAQFTGGVGIADSIFHIGDDNTAIRFPAADTFTVTTAGSEAIRIDSSRRLLVGTSSGSGEPIAAFQGRSNDASDSGIVAITRTGTNPSGSIGELRFATGSDLDKYYGMIICQSDGSTSSTSLPGVLRFSTTATGATSPTERVRIGSSGQIGLDGANYGTSGQVLTSNGSGSAVTWEDASGGGGISTTKSSPSANAVVTINLGTAQHHELTLSAGITTITTSGGTYGESHSLVLIQPSSGIATVGFSTYFLFPSGATPSMSEGSSKVDLVSFVVKDIAGNTGTGATELLASAGLNYS